MTDPPEDDPPGIPGDDEFLPEGDCTWCDGEGEIACNCDDRGCSRCLDGQRTCPHCGGSGFEDDEPYYSSDMIPW